MKINSLEKLFLVLLSDIYFVENQLTVSIPEMSKKAQNKDLKEGLNDHLKETKEQIKRLHKVFQYLGQEPKSVDWINNMHSLFEKGKTLLDSNEPSPALDAAIIVMGQRIEHFEIATYGALIEFADVLGYDEIKEILKDTLKEESHADSLLNKLAKGGIFTTGINVKATK